jgi:hypothetical protein
MHGVGCTDRLSCKPSWGSIPKIKKMRSAFVAACPPPPPPVHPYPFFSYPLLHFVGQKRTQRGSGTGSALPAKRSSKWGGLVVVPMVWLHALT